MKSNSYKLENNKSIIDPEEKNEPRNIYINQGNYNESIQGDYKQYPPQEYPIDSKDNNVASDPKSYTKILIMFPYSGYNDDNDNTYCL